MVQCCFSALLSPCPLLTASYASLRMSLVPFPFPHHSWLCTVFVIFSLQQETLEWKSNICVSVVCSLLVLKPPLVHQGVIHQCDELMIIQYQVMIQVVEDGSISVESADCRFFTDGDIYKTSSYFSAEAIFQPSTEVIPFPCDCNMSIPRFHPECRHHKILRQLWCHFMLQSE